MRSLTSFTPYFAEDVTYALEELHGELNDNVDCATNLHTTGCHLLCHDDVS